MINDIIFKSGRIVVPTMMRREMLEKIHQGHMGMEKFKRRARDVLYWPGMNSQIKDMVTKCNICLEYRKENTKEPMIPFRIPCNPWEMVATDLFTLDNSDYLHVVDYYSRFFEVVKLPNTKSATVIMYLKSIFARHGIPSEVISDNGPQYASGEFKSFAEKWEIKHTTVSPLNPQANGLVEKAVQIVKNLLIKAKEDGRDPYLNPLEYRNTPIDDIASPAQLLMRKRLFTRIPTIASQLQPRIIDHNNVRMMCHFKQQKQKTHYNQHAKSLPQIQKGDRIRMKGLWKPGIIVDKAETPRSFRIRTVHGGAYRRNRQMIIKSEESLHSSGERWDDFQSASQPTPRDDTATTALSTTTLSKIVNITTGTSTDTTSDTTSRLKQQITSSGRVVRKPGRFNNYAMT